jgi:hypothetical protein
MVSSIAIGLGFTTWRGSRELSSMSKIDALALRGVVAAALTPNPGHLTSSGPGPRKTEPPSLDRVYPWHFIR